MQSSQPPLQYAAPLSLYLDTPSMFSKPFPTLEEVRSAIFAVCPYDHETATMSTNKGSSPSLHNLTRILYLPYYPSHLGLLDIPLFIPLCFCLIEGYLQHYKMFDRTFGLVMIKVLTLSTMVGILVQKKQLEPFIASLSQSHTRISCRIDSTPELVCRVSSIIQEEMQQKKGFARGLLLWTESHSIEVDGQLQREGFYTPARCKKFLMSIWEQRDVMLTTLKRSRTPGFSAVLHIIRSNTLENPIVDKDEILEVLSQSQDLVVRYSLVDTPKESATSQEYWISKQYNHLAPVDTQDHQTVTRLLVRRLESPENGIEPLSPYHAKYLLHQFFDGIRMVKAYESCMPIIEAGFEYLWREISRPETKDQKWQDVLAYGIGLLSLVKDRLLEDQRALSIQSIPPAIFKALYKAEFINICARLMLMSPLHWNNPALKTLCESEHNIEEVGIARDGLKVILDFVNALKRYTLLIRPLVEQSYRDWVKVFDFNCQSFAGANPNSFMHMYTELCIRVWAKLGEAFGYFQELEIRRSRMFCQYDRCAGSDKLQGVEQLVCGGCVNIGYCSIQCQRADWPQHKASHAEIRN